SLHAQRGDMIDLDVHEVTVGARGAARLHATAFGQRQELEFGYYARGDDVAGTQQRLEASTGVPYATDTDLDSKLGDIGLYADANLRPLAWVNVRGGVRADLLTYDVLNDCAAQTVAHPSTTNPPIDQSCLSQQDFGRPREPNQQTSTSSAAVLPRASLLLGPIAHLVISASVGKGVRSIDPSYVTQDVKTPFASIAAYDVGVSYAGSVDDVSVVVRSIFFETLVDKDLVFDETVGRNVLGVGTHRTGWVGALRLTGPFFDESANLTLGPRDLRRYPSPRRVHPGRRAPLGHELLSRAPAPARRFAGARHAELRRHLRRAAAASVRPGQRRTLHRRRIRDAGLGALPDRDHVDEPARREVPARRVQLPVRLSQPVAADARAGADVLGGGAPRRPRHARGHPPRRGVGPAAPLARRPAALASLIACACAACVGTTGGQLVTFPAAAAGPADAIAGEPLRFTTDRGWTVVLSTATLHVGALYLDQSMPVSGSQGTNCVLPGTYVGQVTAGLDVNLLSPAPQP